MHGIDIVHAIFRVLEEQEFLNNPAYNLGGVVGALNDGQGKVAEHMRRCDSGFWEYQSDVVIPAGAVGYTLQFFIHSLRSVKTASGQEVWDQNGKNRLGIRFAHDRLRWDTALPAAETWTLRYVRHPWDARYGTLPTQGTGTSSGYLLLPEANYSEGLAIEYSAYEGSLGVPAMGFGILEESSVARQAMILAYAPQTRMLTLDRALSPVAAAGNRFLIMENWQKLWDTLLVYETARLLPNGIETVGPRYAEAYEAAMRAGRERQTMTTRRVEYDAEN